MRKKIAFGIVVLLLIPAVIGMVVVTQILPSDQNAPIVRNLPAPAAAAVMPGPPGGSPIAGERVTLAEAQDRTPFTLPIPAQSAVSGEIEEVWASDKNIADEFKQVYIIYSDGLKISLGAHIGSKDFSGLGTGSFRKAIVKGNQGRWKDPFVKTTNIGTQVNIIGSLSWWESDVDIRLYHPTITMQELLVVAEAMPAPTWK